MYILQNAFKSITRNKLRNILISIIVFVIAVSACVSLSIRQAAETATEKVIADLNITAQISFDRTSAMKNMAKPDENSTTEDSSGQVDRGKFDFSVLQGSTLTLDEYMGYTKAQSEGDSYYYSEALSLDTTDGLVPYGTEESTDEDTSTYTTTQNQGRGMMGGGQPDMGGGQPGGDFMKGMPNQITQGDFSLTGYSSYDAMMDMFGEDGSYSVSDGSMFDETSTDLECIISDELAVYNSLSVGDTITLANPNCDTETYTLTVKGIYTNDSAASSEKSRFQMMDPANNIYMNYNALESIITASAAAGNTTTDSDNEEVSAAVTGITAFTYTFASKENYDKFAKEVYDLGLSEEYIVSSSDLSTFESSLTPLETLSKTAMWFFLIVIVVGGVILITFNIFNLRERKYEVGVLTAIGMKKGKVALQFVNELFIITFVAIIIGAAAGACVSVPVTNALLANQIEASENKESTVDEKFGRGGDQAPDPSQGGGNQAPEMSQGGKGGFMKDAQNAAVDYVDSVSSATNFTVILELIAVGLFLTLISSFAALISIMRYEPLKILSNRS